MLEQLNEAIERFLQNPVIADLAAKSDEILYSLNAYHLIAFGVVFFVMFLLVILAVSLSHIPVLSLILQFFALGFLIAAPVEIYFYIERVTKPLAIGDLVIMPLYYQDKAIVKGYVENLGDKELIDCKIKVKGYDQPKGKTDYIIKLASAKSIGEIYLDRNLTAVRKTPFELELSNTRYDDNLSLSVSIRCR